MKITNKYIISAVAVFLGLAASGCSDWLDYNPKDKQTEDQQFSTPEGFHSTVNGIYNSLGSSSLYGRNLSYGPIDIMGALYNIPGSNTGNVEWEKGTWSGSTASAGLQSIWTSAYRAILNMNLVLRALDEHGDVLTTQDKTLMKGELLALRAYMHFDLARLFGPNYSRNKAGLTVPFADAPEVIKRDRLTAEDIFNNKILPDLIEAQKLLADTDPVLTDGVLNTDGGYDGNWFRYRQNRMNWYAVTLTLARVYLWMGDNNNALAEARKITDSPKAKETFPWVVPSRLLGNNTNPDRLFSTECLFGFYNNALSNIYEYNFQGTLEANVLQPRRGYVDILFPESGDYRRQSQWSASMASASDNDFVKYKGFKANATTPEFWASFFGIMRVSEAYLIAAECLAKANDIAGAAGYINTLKKARGIQDVADNTTQANMLTQIKWEYLREMRGEGQIYFMHKRNWQAFGGWTGGVYAFDATGLSELFDTPSTTVRYTVPVPAAENY